MLKELVRKAIRPIHLMNGDRLRVTLEKEIIGEGVLAEALADKTMTVDTVIIYRFEDMHGLKEGYTAVLGKE